MTTEATHCDKCCGDGCCAHEYVGCPTCGGGDCQFRQRTPDLCWSCRPKVPCAGGCGAQIISGKCLRCTSGEKTLQGAMASVLLGLVDDMRDQLNRQSLAYRAFMGEGDDAP